MNQDSEQRSSGVNIWDVLAETYAQRVETKPHNAYYERPATLSLLPEVGGRRVLDAGCGPGVYAEWLVNHGADVVALDASEKMVEFARARLGSRAKIVHADLEQPLTFFDDASFDLVLSPLVLDMVRDLAPLFREFYRIVRVEGHLIFSLGHPAADYFVRHPAGNYFATELVESEWRGFGPPVRIAFYRRPLGAIINPLLAAGFALERLLEPVPTEAFRAQAPEDYADRIRRPGFLCIRAKHKT